MTTVMNYIGYVFVDAILGVLAVCTFLLALVLYQLRYTLKAWERRAREEASSINQLTALELGRAAAEAYRSDGMPENLR